MASIPHCDALFLRYFAPWYDKEDLAARVFEATRPDMLQSSENIGKSASELCPLQSESRDRIIQHLDITMTQAAVSDFGRLLKLSAPVDFAWLQRIDDYYNRDRIGKLIQRSDPGEDGNEYFISCIELGTLIARLMRSLVPELEWVADSPYWESALWHSPTGNLIPPTHWAIKKFSGYGCEDGLVSKIHCVPQVLKKDSKLL